MSRNTFETHEEPLLEIGEETVADQLTDRQQLIKDLEGQQRKQYSVTRQHMLQKLKNIEADEQAKAEYEEDLAGG